LIAGSAHFSFGACTNLPTKKDVRLGTKAKIIFSSELQEKKFRPSLPFFDGLAYLPF
jgi:hypothetical protein